jgi:hypothetical protein
MSKHFSHNRVEYKLGPRCGLQRKSANGKWRKASKADAKKVESRIKKCKAPKTKKPKRPTFKEFAYASQTDDENDDDLDGKRYARRVTRYHERYGYDVPSSEYPRPARACDDDDDVLEPENPKNSTCWDRHVQPELEHFFLTNSNDQLLEVDSEASADDVDPVHRMHRLKVAREIIKSRRDKFTNCLRKEHKCEPDEDEMNEKFGDRIHDVIRLKVDERQQDEHDDAMEQYYRSTENHDFSQLIDDDKPIPTIAAVEQRFGSDTAADYRELLENMDRSKFDPKFRTDNSVGLMNKAQFQKFLEDLTVLGMDQNEYREWSERPNRTKKRKRRR